MMRDHTPKNQSAACNPVSGTGGGSLCATAGACAGFAWVWILQKWCCPPGALSILSPGAVWLRSPSILLDRLMACWGVRNYTGNWARVRSLATHDVQDQHEALLSLSRKRFYLAASIEVSVITLPLSVPVTFTFCPANSAGFF